MNFFSSDSLCQKAKLPFGLLLHPYKDLQTLPVITTSNIVRCRSCRAYINPFVSLIDVSRWKCNLCGRVNEVPEEFKSNPISKEYGKPEERPECVNSTVEFIAPSEYMSRPPQERFNLKNKPLGLMKKVTSKPLTSKLARRDPFCDVTNFLVTIQFEK